MALRSLAGVVVLMEDRDKLPQLVGTFEAILRTDWSHAPRATTALPCPYVATYASTLNGHNSGGEGGISTSLTPLSASCNWLLPTIAQWCLEVGLFNDLLLEPWLQRLRDLCFVSPRRLFHLMLASLFAFTTLSRPSFN